MEKNQKFIKIVRILGRKIAKKDEITHELETKFWVILKMLKGIADKYGYSEEDVDDNCADAILDTQ